ncbi:hypothetical protein NP233_g3946 [Leucocoprinus birnbaumii]|uniref:Uncharacterized protein n=1 Tax=Leucocoprinus birnbaumii TaxID=56174 RepID=A0AAD5VVM5_9AGAR|nr:hypothetical protein NP233_g3946 [Leucocoprinus birnbaumii]
MQIIFSLAAWMPFVTERGIVLKVWRCYRVQRILGPNGSPVSNIFWLSPLSLWAVMIVTGIVPAGLQNSWTPDLALISTSSCINVLINVYTTVFIVIRVFLHRRATIARLGNGAPRRQHLRLISLVLESAALNIPITIASLVGTISNDAFTWIVYPISVACQSLSAVLLIHQVLSRRVADEQNEQKTEELPTGITSRSVTLTTVSAAFIDNPEATHVVWRPRPPTPPRVSPSIV